MEEVKKTRVNSVPASRLWAEREFLKLNKRITTLIKQYNIIIKRNGQLVEARKRYDLVTVAQRKARTAARVELYRKVDVMWRSYIGKGKDIVINQPNAPENV